MYYLETEHGNSIAPRNQRLIVTHSFSKCKHTKSRVYIYFTAALHYRKNFTRFGCNSIDVGYFMEMVVSFIFILPYGLLGSKPDRPLFNRKAMLHKELFGYTGTNDITSFSKVGP